MQNRPVCFRCDEPVQTNGEMLFEAPCGHETCSSAVFHGLCLMDWREHRDHIMESIRRRMEQLTRSHIFMDMEEGEFDA